MPETYALLFLLSLYLATTANPRQTFQSQSHKKTSWKSTKIVENPQHLHALNMWETHRNFGGCKLVGSIWFEWIFTVRRTKKCSSPAAKYSFSRKLIARFSDQLHYWAWLSLKINENAEMSIQVWFPSW